MKRKIFICDNNLELVNTLRTILLDLTSAEILTETSSKDAYGRIVEDKPHILIVDFEMPNVSGDKLISELRSDGRFRGLYIICISANPQSRQRCLNAGADVFLAKPLDLQELLTQVNQVLKAQ